MYEYFFDMTIKNHLLRWLDILKCMPYVKISIPVRKFVLSLTKNFSSFLLINFSILIETNKA